MAPRSYLASGAVCAGSNPAGGTSQEVPKDPAASLFAGCGVLLFVHRVRPRTLVSPRQDTLQTAKGDRAGEVRRCEEPRRPRHFLVPGTAPDPLPTHMPWDLMHLGAHASSAALAESPVAVIWHLQLEDADAA